MIPQCRFASPLKPRHAQCYSRYEMYANEGRMPGALSVDPHSTEGTSGHGESGPALEFIEYANGDTIW